MKTNCPHCAQPIEAPDHAGGSAIECPTCNKSFSLPDPAKREAVEKAWAKMEQNAAREERFREADAVDKVRNTAAVFTGLAWLFGIVGFLCLFIGLSYLDSSERNPSIWTAMGGSWGAAVWLYLIAQVIHIRALLMERRRD